MELNALYDRSSTMYVLGALLKQPTLVHENKYILTDNDFEGIQKIIFSSVYNLAVENTLTSISAQDIDFYLSQYPLQYEKYKKEKGFDYLLNLSSLVDVTFDDSQFDYYYNRVKKFTILRDLYSNGIDVKEFYNPDVDFMKMEDENQKLNKLEISKIFDRVREKITVVEDKNISKTSAKAIPIGHGLKELIEELNKSAGTGEQLIGEILNYAARGARLGRFYLYSAPTGHGKTRFLVGNACNLSLPYIENGKIIKREGLKPVVFIATEMDPEEIQTLVLAFVSGVDEEKIKDGTYNESEKILIDTGINIMEQYSENFIVEKISDPSISLLRTKLSKYVLSKNISYIFYDYIFTSPSLNLEFSRTGLREDVTLMMLANTLKEIASDYNVFVFSGTQVNREWEKKPFRNENNIAGSKAIADKADFGVVATKLSEDEKEKISTLLKADNIVEQPNIVMDIYKNRYGKIVNAKIFRVFDYGTCRAKDIIMTDTNFNKWHTRGKIQYQYEKEGLVETVMNNVKR